MPRISSLTSGSPSSEPATIEDRFETVLLPGSRGRDPLERRFTVSPDFRGMELCPNARDRGHGQSPWANTSCRLVTSKAVDSRCR